MKIIRISSIWCSSCIVTYKNWKELKDAYPDYIYEEYDYDDDSEIIEQYQVGNILPVIIVLKDDKEIKRIIGEKTKKELFAAIEELN